jgi:long-chain acyl-CoA synthetase
MSTIRTGSPIARMLFERAFAYKKACLLRGDPLGGRWGAFYDRLVFSKLKARLGGEVKLMVTGKTVGVLGPEMETNVSDEAVTSCYCW